MPGSYNNIALMRLNIPGIIDNLCVCTAGSILLYPQTVAGQDITMLVMQTVCKQLQVIPRINQRTVQQGTGHPETAWLPETKMRG